MWYITSPPTSELVRCTFSWHLKTEYRSFTYVDPSHGRVPSTRKDLSAEENKYINKLLIKPNKRLNFTMSCFINSEWEVLTVFPIGVVYAGVGGGHQRLWPKNWTCTWTEVPYSLPDLKMYVPPTLPAQAVTLKDATLRELYGVETHKPGKASRWIYKIIVGVFRDLLIIWLPRTSLIRKFLCLLKLPPTNLKWSASFFSLSLPSMYGGQFANQQQDSNLPL